MSDVFLRVGITIWFFLVALLARLWLEDHLWLRARKRSREPGLNTVADADAFVQDLRAKEERGGVAGADSLGTAGPITPEATSIGPPRQRSVRLSPLEHNDTAVHVPRLRTTPLVGLKAPVAMVRTAEPVFTGAGTPIHDQLVADLKARRRALRWPTAEMRGLFDALVEKWLCSWCEYEGCRGCPGCSCSCKLAVAA